MAATSGCAHPGTGQATITVCRKLTPDATVRRREQLQRRVARLREDVHPNTSRANDYWVIIDAAGQTHDFRLDRSGRLQLLCGRSVFVARCCYWQGAMEKHYENVIIKALDPSQEEGRT